MNIVNANIEAKLLDVVRAVKGEPGSHYAIHFRLSGLQEQYKSEFQLKIAVNILNDIFRVEQGSIFVARDGDLFIIYHGEDRNILEKAVFQLRYLFVDDPLANNEDGSENEDFCQIYDLAFQWRAFHRICLERLELAKAAEVQGKTSARPRGASRGIFSPSDLLDIEDKLEEIELGYALRRQPLCAVKKGSPVKPVFHEVYVNMAHLKRLLDTNVDLPSNKGLFKYLTEALDKKVLKIIMERPKAYMSGAISLNLNVSTILLPEFAAFCKKNSGAGKVPIVIEVNVADVFADMNMFLMAKNLAHDLGCRICLDGLTDTSFIHVDRERLGFDLAKLQWNADMEGDLGSKENRQLAKAIEACGSNRMILCRCDSQHAIDYGHALGISLFQGRYPDRMLDPDSVIIN